MSRDPRLDGDSGIRLRAIIVGGFRSQDSLEMLIIDSELSDLHEINGPREVQVGRLLDRIATSSSKVDLLLRRIREQLDQHRSNYLDEFDAWMLSAQTSSDLNDLFVSLQDKATKLVGGLHPPVRDGYPELRMTGNEIRTGALGVIEQIRNLRDPIYFGVVEESLVPAKRRQVMGAWLRLLESVDSLLTAIDSSDQRSSVRQSDGGASSFVAAQVIYHAVWKRGQLLRSNSILLLS